MSIHVEFISGGGVTSPVGFRAAGVCAGIKKQPGSLDLALLSGDVPCTATGVFTRNLFRAAPVRLCQERLKTATAQAIVVNSGCANAGTGPEGFSDAVAMANAAARRLSLPPQAVLVASTGIIGQRLPMERIEKALNTVVVSTGGGHDFARAIMTTDTVAKEVALRVSYDGVEFVIGGAAKGSGMIHPDMATLLCFLSTDAGVEAGLLKTALKRAADVSFNMVSVDGDTSSNDSLFILASGGSGAAVHPGTEAAIAFQQGLETACVHLAKLIASDGEGATRLLEVRVSGAVSVEDARQVARAIASSALVKTALHGADPNWGRVLAVAGRSAAAFDESRLRLELGGMTMFAGGQPQPFDAALARQALSQKEVVISLDLGLGSGSAVGWGCDLSEDYVRINSEYST